MKKGVGIFLVLFLVAFLSIGLVSANWFSDMFGKVTGKVTAGTPCTVLKCSADAPNRVHVPNTLCYNLGLLADGIWTTQGQCADWVYGTKNGLTGNWQCDDYDGNPANGADYCCYDCKVPVITCTSFTYSNWGSCTSSGKQSRTITASSPSGCIGGTSENLIQNCNYVVPDLTAPIISNALPTGTIYSTTSIINVTTDENATCKFSSDQSNWMSFSTTGSKFHSQYFASLSNGQNTFYVKCKDSSGNENKVSSIVSFTVSSSTPTCSDSDGGLNYYVKGFTNSSFYYPERYWGIQKVEDVCINSTSLQEQACNAIDGLHSPNTFDCLDGCFDGACKNVTSVVEPNPSCFENYKLDFTSFVTNNGIDEVTLKKYDGSWSKQVKMGDTVNLGNVELTIVGINRNAKTVDYSVTSPSIIDYTSINKSSIYVIVNTQPMRYGADYDYFVVSYCGNKTTKTQTCSGLINSIKNPTSSDERHLSWNNSYTGSAWINDKQESYIDYYAAWYWNAREYQEKQVNYYSVSYDVQVFDNENIDLSKQVSWNENNPVCKVNSYWANSKNNYYYICNWNIFNNQQDSNSNHNSNNREIFWYNNNVLVRLYIYWGDSLTDAQVQQLVQQKIGDLINNLQNNQGKYIDWQNFEIVYPPMNELSTTLASCGSDVQVSSKDNQNTWSCKTEPVICPEHGFQTKTCQRWNNEKGAYDTQTQQLDCSPGLCSGCYIPKWFGSNSGDNRCIPYGFRFAQQFGSFTDLVYEENSEAVTISEFNKDFQNSNKEGLIVLEAINASQVLIKVDTNKLKEEAPNFVYTVTIKPDFSSNGIDYYYVSVGQIGNITIQEFAGAKAETMALALKDISFDAINPNNTKVILIVGYTSIRSKPLTMNAYCDIDGLIKEQKAKNAEGAWATCQNNYECRSNLCSEGECIEAISLMKQAQAFIVKVLCKLSNPISDAEYQSCVDQYSQ